MKIKTISDLKKLSKEKRIEYVNEIASYSLTNRNLKLLNVSYGEIFRFRDKEMEYDLETESKNFNIYFHDDELDKLLSCVIDEKIEDKMIKLFNDFFKRENINYGELDDNPEIYYNKSLLK
jgi:hypothetical protein